jgi:uncharacterized RDD family membrane protein YckC
MSSDGPADVPGTKVCPRCAEHVKSAALVCRFCQHQFAPDELAALEGRERHARPIGDALARGAGGAEAAALSRVQPAAAPSNPVLVSAASTCAHCNRPTGNGRACQFCSQMIGADDGARLAGIGQRLGAYSIDVATAAFVLIFVMTTYPNVVSLVVLLTGFSLLNLVLMTEGQTVGKALVGIRAGTYSGDKASFGRTLLRDGIGKPLVTLFTAFIGTLWALGDRDRQALYDKIASTVVIDDRRRVPAIASRNRLALVVTILTLTAVGIALSSFGGTFQDRPIELTGTAPPRSDSNGPPNLSGITCSSTQLSPGVLVTCGGLAAGVSPTTTYQWSAPGGTPPAGRTVGAGDGPQSFGTNLQKVGLTTIEVVACNGAFCTSRSWQVTVK